MNIFKNLIKKPRFSFIVLFVFILIFALTGAYMVFHSKAETNSQIYWGVSVAGSGYGSYGNPPWDMTPVSIFEQNSGKSVSIVKFGLPWYCSNSSGCGYTGYRPFSSSLDAIRQHGSIPFVDWSSSDYSLGSSVNQPKFSLTSIIRGDHDAYIRQWATDAKNYGHPLFLRFDWEMNGDWYPWSERVNGNSQGQYVLAWRHVHDIFTSVGAKNVTWVWCPNTEDAYSTPLAGLYPGDAYVDWTGMDGYNWGSASSAGWQTFNQVFQKTYNNLLSISPSKPIVIAEVGSNELGAPIGVTKANWITDMFVNQLPLNYNKVKAVVWFNTKADGVDWRIETTTGAQNAFKNAISSAYYTVNDFINLSLAPITPIVSVTVPQSPVEPTPVTNLPLTVKINNPLDGSSIGAKVVINVSVNSSEKVTGVEYYIDGIKVSSQVTSPYTYTWQSKKVARGNHTIEVRASNSAGQTASQMITVRK